MLQYLHNFKKYKYFDMSFDIYTSLYTCLGEISNCQHYSHRAVQKILVSCDILYEKLKNLGEFKQKLMEDDKTSLDAIVRTHPFFYGLDNGSYTTIDIKVRLLLDKIEHGIEEKIYDHLLMFVYNCICTMLTKTDEKRSTFIKKELSFAQVHKCVTNSNDPFMCIIDKIIIASTYTDVRMHDFFNHHQSDFKKKYDFILYFYNSFNLLL
tara:strand:+ start:3131 stop:3757 length:627 start_codon:yes stop_codon:yes gene_type:complete